MIGRRQEDRNSARCQALLEALVHSCMYQISTLSFRIDHGARTSHHCVVTLVWFQSNLFERLKLAILELLNLPSKYFFRNSSRINTARLDRDDCVTAILEEKLSIPRDDSSLVGLRHICEDDVDHVDKDTILLWCPRVLHNCWELLVVRSMIVTMCDIRVTFVRFFAMLMRSRPERGENSTAYTVPS